MAMLAGDYKRRVQTAQRGALVGAGFSNDPIHVPAGSSNFEVCPAGSVVTLLSINVTSSAGVNEWFQDANGNKQMILVGALTARDYKQHFYCPWALYVSTDADLTIMVCPPSKGNTVD
jgi:hypothetical protein